MKEQYLLEKRKELVEAMKANGSIETKSVEAAFLKVKRENFVPAHLEKEAYENTSLPIGFSQTISQPSTIAIMLEMLEVKKGETVLEVGSGCGYALALLSELTGEKGKVFGVEISKELFEFSKKNLEKNQTKNAEVFRKDGSLGLAEKAPFDKIIVSAACPFLPKPLFDQLKEKGRAVAPVGDLGTQIMQAISKKNGNPIKTQYLQNYFTFVPLLGKEGFRNEF